MRDMMGMMKKAKEMQDKMAAMQEEIATMEIEASSGGGMVRVTLNGQGHIMAISIDPSLNKPEETEILEDLIMAAHNEAKAQIEQTIATKTQNLTAGLPLPPGFKLPF